MKRVFVVDDDPDFVEITRTILEANGYQVHTASNGAQALVAMREAEPDLVLLDVMMSSVLDGVNLSHAMHADPLLRKVPIVMISSIAESPSAGLFPTDEYIPIDAWITKPVQPGDLLKKVASLLGK
ncbi:MAG: DNA-binding response regulator MtrA [Chloroflexi bacterium ADurb.Bin180]|nr:MAG: DNA-binding response regulator MtrA [Chloroflexi bacterium ADurb.Bin180]HNR96845.1 response regulator [Anaerolineae bacterium]HNT04627.1 response regulator [Anaerolineae bacterium]HOU24631.1 response regulator [Anaerolineae bacterium]HQJ51074.1 response regulator [Anaerolineae bacterium]